MSRAPAYQRIREDIRARILSGEDRPGDKLPTENDLSEHYGVTRMTVRQALTGLVQEGVIVRRVGAGTFVATANRLARPLNRLRGFSEDLEGRSVSSVILRQSPETPPAQVREELMLDADNLATLIERVRLVDGRPVAVHASWIPVSVCPRLAWETLACESLYKFLEAEGIELHHAVQKIFAVNADAKKAEQLKVRKGTALVIGERVTYDRSNFPVEFATTWSVADLPITFELER